jgi:uncharacterized delta-60 repeat protein
MAKHATFLVRLLVAFGATLLQLKAEAQPSVLDPSFLPVQATNLVGSTLVPGSIQDIVRQADGKYIVGGNFTSLNGVPASRLARLEANGTVDVAFTAACGANGPVNSLALQPDGRLLVGGNFTALAGTPRAYIGRLLSSGALDPSFVPYTTPLSVGVEIRKVLLQPDGQAVVCGTFNLRGAGYSPQYIARLQGSNGQYDPSFAFTLPTPDTTPLTLALQPDGRLLVGGNGPSYRRAFMLLRLLPDGSLDPTYTTLESTFTSELNTLALDAAGRIYAGGIFQNGPGNAFVRRYLPDGTLDTSFTYPLGSAQTVLYIKTLALQPNGRLLVGHTVAERVQANGSFDTSFIAGITGEIQRFLVQPDGAILIAGRALAGTGASNSVGLVRVLDGNVLGVTSSVAETRTTAWPTPAHEVLHLRLDAASRPQRVRLLDALGRPVHTLEQPSATLSLPVAGLAAGTYLLQVEYAQAVRVYRRIVLY